MIRALNGACRAWQNKQENHTSDIEIVDDDIVSLSKVPKVSVSSIYINAKNKKTKRISRKSYKEYSKKGRKIMTNARKLESLGLQKSRITEFFAISLDSILNMPLSLNSRHGGFELLYDRKKGRKKRKKGGNKKIREKEVMDEKIQEKEAISFLKTFSETPPPLY